MKKFLKRSAAVLMALALGAVYINAVVAFAKQKQPADLPASGGGYAATGQLDRVGYSAEIYDASNGLPTSDAMYLMSARDGRIWIGGYSGVVVYDGSNFERLDTSAGLTSARAIFEDSKGRIWVGTNDNGVVVIDGRKRKHITYKDDLPSSSVRSFAEDTAGNVFIGTTSGICYADAKLGLHELKGEDLSGKRILRLDTDPAGRIYGQTSEGSVFAVDDSAVRELYTTEDLGSEKITALIADPEHAGMIYVGTELGNVYYGRFGSSPDHMKKIEIPEFEGVSVHWFSADCGRIWVSTSSTAGYLDENMTFRPINDIPMNSGIEMTASDYQGNMWFASSTQGAMKLVTNSFVDVTERAGISGDVTNAVCLHDGKIYIGTDNGLRIIDENGSPQENALTEYIGNARIRCITEDNEGGLWIGTYNDRSGLIHCLGSGDITAFTVEDGLPNDQIRCIELASDGSLIVGTYGGLAVIKDGSVIKSAGADDGITEPVFLCVAEDDDGSVLAGTDGGGMYIFGRDGISKLGRDDGLTSDVVLKIIKDEQRGLFWLVTSNSIEYLKDGRITQVKTFPYNNNYDIRFDDSGSAWVLSSDGIYKVNADDMLSDDIKEYSCYTIANGLPFAITSNPHCDMTEDGELYIPGRNGVAKININDYFIPESTIRTDISSVCCDSERIFPDENGKYTIPASKGRVQIMPSVMDYSMTDPTVRLYLEDGPDKGITMQKSRLSALEYTNLPYGDYKLHLQIIDSATHEVIQDDTFAIEKLPRLPELFVIKLLIVAAIFFAAGLIVWLVMRGTVISKHYEEIYRAKEEAERANNAKTRFLTNMSHELLTPINTISGINEMTLREKAADVPLNYRAFIKSNALDIRSASESLRYLIGDLLDLAEIESGKIHTVISEYDTVDILREIISMTKVQCDDKGLDLITEVDELLPMRMEGDIGKIKQIVMNLLTNSVKYTGRGSVTLLISVEEKNDDECTLRFTVKDTGAGMDDKIMSSLFSVYSRIGELGEQEEMSTGLGLDISSRFAKVMGGSLTAESEVGKGTTFVFTLRQKMIDDRPIGAFAAVTEKMSPDEYVPLFRSPDADLLLVSNDAMTIKVVKGLLKATDVFVTTASNIEECMDIVHAKKINIVLFDMILQSEKDNIPKLLKYDPDLPIYALVSYAAEDNEHYANMGFRGVISKPVDGIMLERTVMRHLDEDMMEKNEDLYSRR